MIEEVLAEITAAEEKAAQILVDAQSRAREISLAGAVEAEAVRAEFAIETKRAVKEILDRAECEADKQAQAAQKEAEVAARELIRAAEKNVRSTGEWLFERLTRGKI
ncbi:MAG: hypothetical protein K2L51_02060 [Clostridiales bacterium]|nr:hypothetical protein [Clostridiales bacterium]